MAYRTKGKKKPRLDIKEIRATDRVFQINRDTFLVYVGLQLENESPFVRVGSGRPIPRDTLSHIGSVVLPEKTPPNIAMEMEWLEESLRQGQGKVHYLGAKNQIAQLQRLARAKYSPKRAYLQEEDSNLPLEAEIFGPPIKSLGKNKVTVNHMRNGNFMIFVGTTRVFDSSRIEKGRIGIEREYSLLEEALSKQSCRLERTDKRSFIWLGRENSIDAKRPFLYWNLRNSGVLVNPCFNYHQVLFEERINSRRARGFLSYSGQEPGFVEGIRHQDALQEAVSFFSANEDIASSFKKIYPNTKLLVFHDSNPVPFVSDTNFFVSRSKSHAAFTWRFHPEAEQITQFLFPLGGPRPRRAFALIRAPHDVEVQVIDSRDDFKNSLAHIALQIPGDYSRLLFESRRLRSGAYPLVPHKEYILHESLDPKDFTAQILKNLQGISGYELLHNFLKLHLGTRLSPAVLNKVLKTLRKVKVPFQNFTARHNLWSYFQFIKSLPVYENSYTRRQKRSLAFFFSKFSPFQISYSKWLSLESQPIEFHIFLLGGSQAFLFTREIEVASIVYKLPPPLAQLSKEPRVYARQLRIWERNLGRYGDPGGFRYALETLSKIYEENLRLLEERKRLYSLIESLGLTLGRDAETREASTALGLWANFVQLGKNLNHSVVSAMEKIGFGGVVGNLSASFLRIAPISLLLALLLFGMVKTLGYFTEGISALGDSSREIVATRLAAPESLQNDDSVPGEEDVEASIAEISQYVNVLAQTNGFRSIRTGEIQEGTNPRDIDLVFPGDRLFLPDRRITNIEKGEHVWEIAREHYRKDFARIQIMQRQIYALLNDTDLPLRQRRQAIGQKQALMRRLAVTTAMRSFLRDVNQEVAQRLR